ncbi:MAG TPA: transketolase C-terminal domain-containing protein [Bryobacteraceae bacterium]|nr:transketolase C-terminal domain-containing protein [Bryobacteraceae bacterium]
MSVSEAAAGAASHLKRDWFAANNRLRTEGVLKLLAIKDSDIRLLNLEQARTAVDKGIHAGGAFSAVIPLVSLFYGGFIDPDVEEPTRPGQDMFVLSKGHAVATMASIYAEFGYFDRALLRNSRSYDSILNGHPGPLLPGVHIATGPMGQGLGVAQGFAMAGKRSPRFDVFAMTGDGELQEGPIWEAVMYAAYQRLDNLCVLVDRNNGQLDVVERMVWPAPDLESVFRAFGWRVENVDATKYEPVCAALDRFRNGERNGKPTAILCNCSKGQGGFSDFIRKHKVEMPDALTEQETVLQESQRASRVAEFAEYCRRLGGSPEGEKLKSELLALACEMRIAIREDASGALSAASIVGPAITRRAPRRDKSIRYDAAALPRIEKGKDYAASAIITAAMKVFAKDSRVVSIDSDLASTSGLEAGIAAVDQYRAFNVGVAEANMMLIGEAYAALGCNTWVSTFCPFFDWKVLRRIAVGHQERLEAMAMPDGWLTEGYGLDLNFLATAANFETRTNGATHMGNDDITIFDGIAHLKIIDVACPQQLLGIMKWIMAGNRGLTYVRVLRAASGVIYGPEFEFEFGKGYFPRRGADDAAVIVSSGRGVHEALAAAAECEKRGLKVGVVDMPSIDEALLLKLHDSGKLLCFAEQNNGYIWRNFQTALFRRGKPIDPARAFAVNTLDAQGKPQFIHSGTYAQLLSAFELSPAQLALAIGRKLQ